MAIDWTKIYKKYKGLWVALKHDEETVVGSGINPEDALAEAKKNGYQEPILMHMPDELIPFIG